MTDSPKNVELIVRTFTFYCGENVICMQLPDTELSHITSSLCASSKKLTSVIHSFNYHSPDLPSPDGH